MKSEMLHDRLWPTIAELAAKSRHKQVAVAYLGRGAHEILRLGKGDSLVVDMSEGAVKNGSTDPREVEWYVKKGVDVYTFQDLHAKLYIFDKTLIIGSPNVSKHSQDDLIEAALLCRDNDALTQARSFVKRLQLEPVTRELLRQRKKDYKPPLKVRRPKLATRGPGVLGSSPLWIVGVRVGKLAKGIEEGTEKEEKRLSERIDKRRFQITFIAFIPQDEFGRGVQKGDQVIQVLHEGKRIHVCPPAGVIEITRRQKFKGVKHPRTIVYLEEQKGSQTLAWTRFRDTLGRFGFGKIGQYPVERIVSPKKKLAVSGLWSP